MARKTISDKMLAFSSSTLTGGSASYGGVPVAGNFAYSNPSFVPTSAGSYTASIVFNPTDSYNYTTVVGSVSVTVNRLATGSINASTSPNPSILGQTIKVNFTVPGGNSLTPTGSVTVTDVSGASCTGALTNGSGSCNLSLPEFVNGNPTVGKRTLTLKYSGDANFTDRTSTFIHNVWYMFTGFYSPLAPVGDTSYSGVFNLSKSVTLKWTLQDYSGTTLGILNANILYAIGPLAPNANGSCPLPAQVPVLLNYNGAYPAPVSVLYSPTQGAKGNSTFRIASSNNQYIFNWDTSTATSSGCYVVELDLNSGQALRTSLYLK